MKIILLLLIFITNCTQESNKDKNNQIFALATIFRVNQSNAQAQASSSHTGSALEFYNILVRYRQNGSYTLANGTTRTFLNSSRCSGSTGEHPALIRAAQKHTENMIRGNFFSHTGQDNSSPSDRVRAEGLNVGAGENIAAGQTTAESVFDAWWNSSGHRSNMENCGYTHIGIGYALKANINNAADYPVYWTNVFATIR